MKRQAITVTINSYGQATVTVEGVPGPACEDVTKDLETALGAVVERARTSEYFEPGVATQQQTRR